MNWQTLDKLNPKPTRQAIFRLPGNKDSGSRATYVIRWTEDTDMLYLIGRGESPYDAFAEIDQ